MDTVFVASYHTTIPERSVTIMFLLKGLTRNILYVLKRGQDQIFKVFVFGEKC